MKRKLDGKIAIVTASSRGIGFASANILAENGAKVYIAVFSEEEAKEALEEINSKGNVATYVYFDAYDKKSCTSMIEEVVNKEGKVDILVNNFGSTKVKVDLDVVNGDPDEFINIINNNLRSVYLPSKAVIPIMAKNGGGSIVNISSIGSILPDLSRTAYCVSKAAINSLTQNIALQYGKDNIRCNAVLPGMTLTKALLENMPKEFLDDYLKHVPLKRVGHPEDIAKAVLYYASDDSSYVTGMIHVVSGGFALGTPQYADMIK